MILKIRKNHKHIHAGWFVTSGISDISYTIVMGSAETSEDLANSWLKEGRIIGDEEGEQNSRRRYFPPDSKSGEWIRIIVDFTDGRNEEWMVQAETYLLNDEGKTIERIF